MFEWYWAFVFGYIVHTITVIVVSIFLHRMYAHKHLLSTPAFDTMSRIWLWMVGAYWPKIARIFAAVHRKHHAMPDTLDDPHTPWIYSCRELLFPTTDREKGKAYYMPPEERDSIAGDVPAFDDKLDIFLMKYLPYSKIPLVLVFLTLFSWQGAIIGFVWLTISRYSGRLHNCVSHKYGYRWQPAKTEGDRSVNCLPIGLVFGGEELGANHHDYPDLVNFAIKWYEFDTGWYVVKVLEFFKLVKIVKS